MTLSPWRPWRSVWLARVVLVAALIAGVPPFLRMPPWCDLTLYDVAARNLLTGGVHYRDVFDTNMPGFVWVLSTIRASLGWSVEAVRVVDLVIVAAIVMLLDRLAARAGASPSARAWAIAGVALFYPFTSEFNHCQRDVWMLLPALAAVLLRVRRLQPLSSVVSPRAALLEGILWGLAVWIKPHVVIPAAVVWLLTAPYRAGRRALLCNLLGNVLGGLLIGAAGIAYLVASGTWPYFVEVFTVWNTGYAAATWNEFPQRLPLQWHYFPPWSYLQLLSIPVAVLSILDARPGGPVGRWLPSWLWDAGSDDAARFARLALSAVYLGWTLQALILQREFHYVHVPEIVMLLFILATQRWAAGCLMFGWLTVTSILVLAGTATSSNTTGMGPPRGPAWAILHPSVDPTRWKWWAENWRTDLSSRDYRQRMNALAMIHGFHSANDWEQLGEVADWFRLRGIRDGELLCWDDAPHALYLELNIRPAFRFQHVGQMTGIGPTQEARVRSELCAVPRPRWVVADLLRLEAVDPELAGRLTDAGPDHLPSALPPWARREFPYDQPAAYRSGNGHGRYVVFELLRPIPWCAE